MKATPEPALDIRPVNATDLSQLLKLYQDLIPDDPALPDDVAMARFSEILSQPGMTVLGCFAGEHLVSTCTLIMVPNLTRGGAPYAFIENVVTDASHRQKGHARRVLDRAVEQAFDAGSYKVMLMTGARTPGTLEFYQRCGFRQTKTAFERRP